MDNNFYLMFVQKHLTLREASAFKMFILEYLKAMGKENDFLEISRNENMLKEFVNLYKKYKQ